MAVIECMNRGMFVFKCTYRLNVCLGRSLHVKSLKMRVPWDLRPVRKENAYIHDALEKLPEYETHVIPHPRKILSSHCTGKNTTVYKLLHDDCLNFDVPKSSSTVNLCRLFENSGEGKLEPFVRTEASKVNGGSRSLIETFKRRSFQDFTQPKHLDELKSIKGLLQEVNFASDDEFLLTMLYACLWTSKLSKNFIVLKNGLDVQCCKRFLNWTVERQLIVADIWYHLSQTSSPNYFELMIGNVPRIIDQLTQPQLIHVLFIINLNRKTPSDLMEQIERKLERISDFTTEEMAVTSLSFFKTSSKISSDIIIKRMIEHLMDVVGDVDPILITCIVKSLRYSFRYENRDQIQQLLKKAAEHRVWQDNFIVGMHLCLLAINHAAYVPELLDGVIKDMMRSEDIRLKDIAQILLTVTKFNHLKRGAHDDVLEYIIRELKSPARSSEIHTFPHTYLSCLLYMAYTNVFMHSEIHTVLSKDFYEILKANSNDDFSRVLGVLDCLVEIDEPLYTGNRLDPDTRKKYLKRGRLYYPTKAETKTFREFVMLNMWEVLRKMVNADVALVHILPYMDDPVFLLIIDENGKCHMPSTDFMDWIAEVQFAKRADGRKWVVVWPLTKKDVYCDVELTGLNLLKERHFQKLGFEVIKVPVDMYNNLPTFLRESLKHYLNSS